METENNISLIVLFLGKHILNLEISKNNTVKEIVNFLDDFIKEKEKEKDNLSLTLHIDKKNIIKNYYLRISNKYKDVKLYNQLKEKETPYFEYKRKTLEDVEEERKLDEEEFIEERLKRYRKNEKENPYYYNTQCIKIDHLRKAGYENLREWMSLSSNLYVGRAGRIFITEEVKDEDTGEIRREKTIFHYPKSKWANPYKIEEGCNLAESVRLYHIYLKENDLLKDLSELKGKTLGCFCDQKHVCHAKELIDLLNSAIF